MSTLFNRSLSALLIVLFVSACASSSRITVQSEPARADIYVRPLEYGDFNLVGATPTVLRADELIKRTNGAGPMEMQIRKSGYVTSTLIISDVSAVDLNITKELEAETGLEDQQNLNWVVDSLFQAKSMVSMRQYSEALNLIEQLKKVVPQISALYEMEGGILYLQRKYKMALESYRLAAKYNPKNPDILQMRDMLEERLGLKDSSKFQPSPTEESAEQAEQAPKGDE